LKCDPDGYVRLWNGGDNCEKCHRCQKGNLPCSAPTSPPRDAPVNREQNIAEADGDRDVLKQRLVNTIIVKAVNYTNICNRLADLKGRMESYKMLISVKLPELIDGSPLQELESASNAIRREILTKLAPAESLADRIRQAGDTEAALNAYVKLLEMYKAPGISAQHETFHLAKKIAKMFFDIGDTLEAEKLSWEALDVGELTRAARPDDLSLLKDIARYVSASSKQLAATVNSTLATVSSVVSSNVAMPLPPLQGMMQSRYASNVVGNVFQAGFETPVTGGIPTILDLLRVFPDNELSFKDFRGKVPLHLAASLKQEQLGHGLMLRAKELDWPLKDRVVNCRDHSGQTILGCAVAQGCSLDFIETLVTNGAEVDPDSFPGIGYYPYGNLTPLQQASLQGRIDVVELLLLHGADRTRDDGFEGTPEVLARQAGHDAVVRLLKQN
jgi:hypothetical protein